MITFIFSTFGSLIVLAIYFMITLVVGMATMRKIAPNTFKSITTGEKEDSFMYWGLYAFIALGVFIFWPFIVIAVIVAWIIKQLWILVFFKIGGPLLLNLFKTIDKITPDISININKNN